MGILSIPFEQKKYKKGTMVISKITMLQKGFAPVLVSSVFAFAQTLIGSMI